ncbi:MAG: cytochrome-c peroxidase [Verrucomicrobia bacterium]|nr:cytochrome-c peroxidase [Verrucomicrobiota bacterium]
MNTRLSIQHPLPSVTWLAGLTVGVCLTFNGAADPVTTNAFMAPKMREPIRPIPLTVKLDARKVALGNRLFHEPMLSKDNTVSCATCHELSKGGTDQRARSVGIKGAEGPINAPTVFNCALNFKQFWDGRAETLEEQVEGPTQAPAEMGATWEDMLAKLQRSSDYATAFKAIYLDGVQRKNVKDAIAEFERSLITPNARFDQYLRGDDKALTDDEKEGYRKFKGYGCISCHQGVNVGGNMFQPLGVMGDYFGDRGNVTKTDLGRFNVTGDEDDKYKFKVASLRNIALTGPYFHDGSAKTLEEAVTVMAKYQLGRALPPKDLEQVVMFLKSLTGEYNGKLLQ